MDFSIIHSGMVGFLALLATLLISIAIMIYDRASDNGNFRLTSAKPKDKYDEKLITDIDDTFPWEKIVILKYVAMAPYLFISFMLASISLVFMGFEICEVRVISLAIYLVCIIFISIRIWKLGEWLYSQAYISTSETYRQKMKYKFLRNLDADVELVNIWTIIWNNISLTNPYQAEYVKIFLRKARSITDGIGTWGYFNAFLQGIKNGNINAFRPDILKILLEYSLDAFAKDNDNQKIYLKSHKRQIFSTLIESQISGDDTSLGHTFDIIKKYVEQRNDGKEIMYTIAVQFFSAVDKTKVDNDKISHIFTWFPHADFGVANLLSNEKTKKKSKHYAQIWLFAYDNWFKRNYGANSSRNEQEKYDIDKRIDIVTRSFLGDAYFTQVGERLFGDLVSFYGLTGWGVTDDEKTTEDSWVRIFVDQGRIFMSCDMYTTGIDYRPGESDEDRQNRALEVMDLQSERNDKNTITILKYLFPLSNAEHVNNVLQSIKRYRKKTDDDIKISRLDRLEYDFKLIKKYNKEIKDDNRSY